MHFSSQLVAHRGWRLRYPENTLVGIEAAIQAGARHVEIDVQLTADHVAMLCHDHALLRICGVDRDICQLPRTELAGLSAYEPERLGDRFLGTPLSALSELVTLLQRYPDVRLYAEIKRHSLRVFGADSVLHSVLPDLHALRGRCYVISFDVPVLEQARRAGWKHIAPVLIDLEQLRTERMTQLAPDMVFCDSDLLTEGTSLKTFPYPAAVYEIDRYDDALHWFDEGAALVETFAIGELIAAHSEALNG